MSATREVNCYGLPSQSGMLEAMKFGSLDLDAIKHRLCELLEPRPEILEAYLFGSVARGEDEKHSDIDVAVFTNQEIAGDGGFGYRAELTTDLMAGLGTNSIDIVILNQAPPLLYHRVLRDGIRLLSRDLRATTTREARALSRYCDYVPQLDKVDRALARARSSEAPLP